MKKLEQKHELLENEDLVDMWRKINEIIDTLNLWEERQRGQVIEDCLCDTLPYKHNHSRGVAGCGECQKEKSYMCYEYIHKKVPCEKCTEVPECLLVGKEQKEKQLFDMVYNWGNVGIEVDEKCNAFQDLLKEIKDNK